jgi:hypothetical protein
MEILLDNQFPLFFAKILQYYLLNNFIPSAPFRHYVAKGANPQNA